MSAAPKKRQRTNLNRILEEIAKDPHKRQNEVRKKFDTLENEFISTVQAKDREMSFAERSEMMQIAVSKVLQGIESLEKSWNIV
jgi:vacuolar-type H+-ATPase subunit E/Vma4